MKATVKFNGKEYDAVLIEKKSESKRWKPEIGDYYCFVNGFGDIDSSSWDNEKYDDFRYSQRNVFKTEEEAQKHLEYLKSLAILRDDAGDWEPDLDNHRQYKHYVCFGRNNQRLHTNFTNWFQTLNIYFETKEAAQKSIDEHKEHWLRVLGVEEDL